MRALTVVPGDLVVGVVRVPDPVPCECCAAGEWDLCRSGLFTERGIKGRHGFGRERYRIDAAQRIKVDGALGERAVLLEPISVVATAWEHALHIDARA
jgi:threonine dehydrogenase-like Zn-dependent dehydrogenase